MLYQSIDHILNNGMVSSTQFVEESAGGFTKTWSGIMIE
jgi:hypothetical protein